jgi:hypothetical protein
MKSNKINYFKTIIFALAFGIPGALLWFGITILSGWQIGLVAVGVGYLVGLGTVIGSGNKTGIRLQLLSATVSLITIIMGEYFIANHYVHQALNELGITNISYFINPVWVFESLFEVLKEDPITLLFWGIAVYVGFSIPKEKKEVD